MPEQPPLTVGEVATIYGVPAWKIRRLVDAMDAEIPRAGLYRLIPRSLLGRIAIELERRAWLTSGPAAGPCVAASSVGRAAHETRDNV